MSRYRGNRRISQITSDCSLTARVEPSQITMLTKLLEGFDHLVFAVPLEPKAGRMILHTTPGQLATLVEVLGNLPFAVEIE